MLNVQIPLENYYFLSFFILILLLTVNQPCHNNGGCSHGCAVVNEEAQCYCPMGYQLSVPGGSNCVGKLKQEEWGMNSHCLKTGICV